MLSPLGRFSESQIGDWIPVGTVGTLWAPFSKFLLGPGSSEAFGKQFVVFRFEDVSRILGDGAKLGFPHKKVDQLIQVTQAAGYWISLN